MGSSPHTRGAQWVAEVSKATGGIIPAYAGSTRYALVTAVKSRDHPRIRGEHTVNIQSGTQGQGSSPHTRGAPGPRRRVHRRRGIIPAYAGSTSLRIARVCSTWDHPRIRGEHLYSLIHGISFPGSSPHTRGAPYTDSKIRGSVGIIPAYAGSTRRA